MVDVTKSKIGRHIDTKNKVGQSVSVSELAKDIGIEPNRLLNQFHEAGIDIKDSTAEVIEEQKQMLLAYLQKKGHSQTAQVTSKGSPRILTRRKETTQLHGNVSVVTLRNRKKIPLVPPTSVVTSVPGSVANKQKAVEGMPDADASSPNVSSAHAEKTDIAIAGQVADTSRSEDILQHTKTEQIADDGAIKRVKPESAQTQRSTLEQKTTAEQQIEQKGNKSEIKSKQLSADDLEDEKRSHHHKKKKSRSLDSDDHLELLRGSIIDIRTVLPPDDEDLIAQSSASDAGSSHHEATTVVAGLTKKITVQGLINPRHRLLEIFRLLSQ